MTAAAQPRPEKGIPYDEWHDTFGPEARLIFAECFAKHRGFTIPNPLGVCYRCENHAGIYSGEDGLLCGFCGPRVSIFVTAIPANDLRQRAADAALREVLFR